MARKTKSHEEFIQEVYNIYKDEYTVIGRYINSRSRVLIRHNSDNCDNYSWEVFPQGFLEGKAKCPYCASNKKTHNQFIREIKELTRDEYTVLGKYTKNDKKIIFRHNSKKCNNYEWTTTPSQFLSGQRCPYCNGNAKMSTEEFSKKIAYLTNGEFSVIGELKNLNSKVSIRHNSRICNYYEFEALSYGLLTNKINCPKCIRIKNADKFREQVFNLVGNEYSVLGEYIKTDAKILIKHNSNKCNNHEFEVSPRYFLNGKRCPICYPNKSRWK